MQDSITLLLTRASAGDEAAFSKVLPFLYQDLHRIAEGRLRHEMASHTFQPTDLLHEAYLKLAGYHAGGYRDRTHFFAVAARVMRQILVDHARARDAGKRNGGVRCALNESLDFAQERSGVLLSLDDALNELAKDDAHKARLVEMRFFGGMTAENISECLTIPVHTVRRELRIAQTWLRREMAQ